MRATQPLKHTCKRIYFIRHGQSEANALKDSNATAKFQDGKYMGNPSDIPEVRDAKLTALGRAQAACWHTPNALAAVFQELTPEVVVCSPLRRALETATLCFQNEPNIPLECSRVVREHWWKHYQCIGVAHEETLDFAKTLGRQIEKMDALQSRDQWWDPEMELKEIELDRDDDQASRTELYDPSDREAKANCRQATIDMLIARKEQAIFV